MKINKNDIDRQSRDELLGKMLAKSLAESDATGNCLSDEELAALLDHTLAADDQEQLQKHIAGCEDCLARYTMAVQLHVPQAQPAGYKWYGYAAGLTAVAAAFMAIIMTNTQTDIKTTQIASHGSTTSTVQDGSRQVSPQSKDSVSHDRKVEPVRSSHAPLTAIALAEGVYDSRTNNVVAASRSTNSYAFSRSVSPARAAFRAGVASIDLAAALASGDNVARSALVDRLSDLMGTDSEVMGIKEILKDDTPARMRQCYLDVVKKIEQHAGQKGQGLNFRFGAWSEAGHLAGDDKLQLIVNKQSIRSFIEGCKGDDVPESVKNSLEKLDALVVSFTGTERDIRLVKRTLGEIVEMY